jgi:hypothetical protein
MADEYGKGDDIAMVKILLLFLSDGIDRNSYSGEHCGQAFIHIPGKILHMNSRYLIINDCQDPNEY